MASHRVYDHRLKALIVKTKNPDLFPDLGIPLYKNCARKVNPRTDGRETQTLRWVFDFLDVVTPKFIALAMCQPGTSMQLVEIGGAIRIRTGVRGFAIRCLASWLLRRR